MSILDRIIEYSPQERTPKQDGGMLVKPSADGLRPGYKGPEQQFKPIEGAPARLTFDKDKKLYRKRVQVTVDGKRTNKYIYSKPGESLEQFMSRKPVRSTGADDATVLARNYVNSWTKNWFDQNLDKYGVKDFDGMLNDLSNAWDVEIESGNVPKASGKFNLSTPQLNLPNITTLNDTKTKKGLTPFEYNNVRFYSNLESSKEAKNKTLAQFKKVFYKNQIETNPILRRDLDKFFNFMSQDKRGLYRTLEGKTIKQFMDTEVSDDVKYLLDPKASGLDKASKNEVFNAYKDLANNYTKFTEDKVRLKAVQSVAEAATKAGEKTTAQTENLIKQIRNQNKVLANMSVENIAKDKKLLNSVRLSINPNTGEVSFNNYTANDPKGKPELNDLELAKKIKEKAQKGNFYTYDHISKRSFGKMNTQFPNNIQSANYMTNSQLENARRFFSNPQNRNTPNAQILDKTLADVGLTIRGKEYGGTPIGNKTNIIYDSKTGRSNLVDSQILNQSTTEAVSDLNKIDNATQISLAKIGCPGKAGGGRVGFNQGENFAACVVRGVNKLQTTDVNKLTPLDKANIKNITKTAKGVRMFKNILGPGALAFEGLFAAPFAAYDYARGRPGVDIAKSALSFGLLDDKLTQNELKKIYKDYGKIENLKAVDDRIQALERLQGGTRGQRIRSKPKLEKATEELSVGMQPFLKDPERLMMENLQKSQEAEQQLQKEYDIRSQERKTPFDLSDPFMAAGGGIAEIRRPNSIPPQSGPTPQGLLSIKNNVKRY